MEHELESVGNQHGEDKGQEQSRMHEEALARARSRNESGVVPGMPAPIETADAVLNWASGNGVASTGRGDSPFTSGIAEVAGVAARERMSEDAPPSHGLTGVGDFSEGNWNAEQIFRGGKR